MVVGVSTNDVFHVTFFGAQKNEKRDQTTSSSHKWREKNNNYENNCNYIILDEYKYYYTMDSMILRFVNSNVCTIHEHPSVFEQKIKLEMKKEKYSYCKNTLDSLRNNNDMSYNLINMLSKLDKPSRKRWIS